MMITTENLTVQSDINRIFPACVSLARNIGAPLPFQYMHMPITWWKAFHTKQKDLFCQKRGKNFLGVQSRRENFSLLIARNGTKLCGVAPLAQYALKIPACQEEIHVLTLAGDYVLHPFQDFIVDNVQRKKVIAAMLGQVRRLLKDASSVFWAGYLPEKSPNLDVFRKACGSMRNQDIECIEAISSQRGGVWPWTIVGISTTLKKISSESEKSGNYIKGLADLTTKVSECNPESLFFPSTRADFLHKIKNLLLCLRHFENLSAIAGELDSFLKNSPILYPYIELPRDREQYLSSLSYSTRRYFRRYMKKFLKAGGSFETVLPDEITDQDIETYIRLHLLRWGNASAAMCANAANYHRKISKSMAEMGLFLLFFARFQGKRIAVHSCFDIGSCREGYITGRDTEYSELRAGRLLYIQTILDAIDKGLNRYELGAVGFDYKMSFAHKATVAHNFFLYSSGHSARLDDIFTGFECMEQVHC